MSKQEPFIGASKVILGEENAYFMTKKDTLADVSSIKLVAKYNGMNVEQQDDLVINRSKYEKSGEYAEIYEIADQLNGVAIGTSRHPCAAMLYDGDIEKTFGLIRFKDGTIGVPVTGTSADTFKFLKLDFLVATTWTIIDNAFKDAGLETPSVKELSDLIYAEDSRAFDIAGDGITATVCQFNTANGKQKIMEFKPKSVGEMSDLSAIMRPGAASILDMFLKRTNFKYGVPVLDDYLANATGCGKSYMIYQEHAMQVMQMAGITLADSYVVLKAISKKKEDVINSFREQFINGFTDYLMSQNDNGGDDI